MRLAIDETAFSESPSGPFDMVYNQKHACDAATKTARFQMEPSARNFIFTNANYDQEQIETSSRLAHVQASQRPDFVFINSFDNDHDPNRKKDSRRVVRSRATAYSHRVAPRGAARPEAKARAQRVLRSLDAHKSTRRTLSVSTDTAGSNATSNGQLHKRARLSPLHVQTSPLAGAANISRKRARSRNKRDVSPGGKSDRSISPGHFDYSLPNPAYMDANMRDPFDTYPVQYRNWYGQLIQFWYNVVFMRGTRVIKASKAELQFYTIWSRQQEMAEPALYYTSLFLASGIPVAEGYFPLKAALWLRYKTIEAMKDAIADPNRSLSTPVILAVGRIALHEHIYGNRELAHGVHRPAQKRMIDMRGGLANLDIPDTVKQLIVWTDALLSAEAGTEPYFADVPKQISIRSYTPEEAMHVTNYCSPKRGAHPGYGKGTAQPDEPEQ